MIYDFGSSDQFDPADFLREYIIPHLDKYKGCRIAQSIISHPHADHISNINCLFEPDIKDSDFYSKLHTCPHDKRNGSEKPECIDWKRIKNPNGTEENIEKYKKIYADRNLPLQIIIYESDRTVPNLEYGIFYVRPPIVESLFPKDDQEYGNGISIVFYYRHGVHSLLIPGDINSSAFKILLDELEGSEKRYTIFSKSESISHPHWHDESDDQPSLKSLLKLHGLSILVAPHHGLESGYSIDLYKAMKDGKPGLVVISEKKHRSEKDGEIHEIYRTYNGAAGQSVNIEGRESSTPYVETAKGHHILIMFQGTGGLPEVFLESDPKLLISKLK
jgi:hypothetical protein